MKRIAKPKYTNTPKNELIDEIKARFNIVKNIEADWRNLAIEDMEYMDPGKQWDPQVKASRLSDGRPVISVDRISPIIRQICNDARMNCPSIKVSPVDNNADVDTASIISGLIKNIEYTSGARMAYITAYENAVKCGKGWLRIYSDYTDEMSFEQDLKIESIANPLQVYFDPAYTLPDGSDAEWAMIATDVPKDQFLQTWPNAEMSSCEAWEADGNELIDYDKLEMVRIIEYFVKVRKQFKIHQLESGEVVVGDLPEGIIPVQSRDTYKTQVRIVKTQGVDILDDTIWPCSLLPIIPVFGEVLTVNNKRDYRGVIRTAKDPQKLLNLEKSSMTELVSSAPRAPWIVAKGSLGNRAKDWALSNTKNIPYLEYEHFDDDRQIQYPTPQRNFGEAPIQAMAALSAMSESDIKAVTSSYDPVMGKGESNQSGVAIAQLRNQSQTSTYHFTDSLARALRLVGREIVEVIKYFYNTERVIRIIGDDDVEKQVTINGPDVKSSKIDKIFDLTVGKYDVAISQGPGYETKRAETQAVMLEILKIMPQLAQIAPDQIITELWDSPSASNISKRLKASIPKELLTNEDKEGSEDQGQQLPPEVMQTIQQLTEMNKALTEELNEMSKTVELKQYEIDSKERIALLQEESKLTIEMLKLGNAMNALKFQREIDARQAELKSEPVVEKPEPEEQELPELPVSDMEQPNV